jgi:hypothetical protein
MFDSRQLVQINLPNKSSLLFKQELDTYNEFDDGHDKVAIAGVNFISRSNLWSLSARRCVLMGTPMEILTPGS